ncbi:HAD-IA family hydrolase [Vibrio sp. TH_r3]|uniref:HAD family hydrolase n=1 Tax=Vibrio sp. TH_r3 TaxID=3082084 RepID=UPI002953171E|nr:HAD-IA family hydrolase [Vibrio sp. TH_r3]MDV7105926.1 HAD-IA family hydrolase [Vibrio sp. TH_r3]
MKNKRLFIFDMDGVLLDSEPYWRAAQIDLLDQFGVRISSEDCIRNTMGKRIDDIAIFWIDEFSLNVEPEYFATLLLKTTAGLIRQNAKANPGLYSLIEFLQQHRFVIALATSSSKEIITAVLQKLQLEDVFAVTVSADSVKRGKPAPDVYLNVCARLNISTEYALALEDSLTGVKSALAANITTIAIPETGNANVDFSSADFIVSRIGDVIKLLERD